MKMAFFEIKPFEAQFLEDHLKNHEVHFFENPLTNDDLDHLHGVDVLSLFIYSQLSRERIEAMPRLRLIATRSTGYDHIDLTVCQDRNITISVLISKGRN